MEGCFKVVIIMEEQKTLLKKLGQNFTFEGIFFLTMYAYQSYFEFADFGKWNAIVLI